MYWDKPNVSKKDYNGPIKMTYSHQPGTHYLGGRTTSGDHPWDDLARFGYILDMKVGKNENAFWLPTIKKSGNFNLFFFKIWRIQVICSPCKILCIGWNHIIQVEIWWNFIPPKKNLIVFRVLAHSCSSQQLTIGQKCNEKVFPIHTHTLTIHPSQLVKLVLGMVDCWLWCKQCQC